MKTQFPWIGRARGSAGGMTAAKVYDKNVMRAKAFEVNNPNTQPQQTQRAFFALLTGLCADFSDAQLRTLFPNKPKSMSRRNALSKQIAAYYAISGTEKTIDYANIDTLGNASVMDFGVVSASISEGILEISLPASVTANPELAPYLFMVAVVNADKEFLVLNPVAEPVSTGTMSIEVPADWSNEDGIHAIPFILDAKGNASTPVTFGTMAVTKRPARKND